MLGLMVIGVILALMGLSIMSGLMQVLIDWTGNLFIFGGIATAVVGGASMIFGDLVGKIIGVALLIVGIAVSVCQGRGNDGPPRRREVVPLGAIVQHRCQC